MIQMFRFNWEVREEWFDWCKQVDEEELIKTRIGGMQSILHNLYHIVLVEYEWINDLRVNSFTNYQYSFSDYNSLDKIIKLSNSFRPSIEEFVQSWSSDQELKIFYGKRDDGSQYQYFYGEILRHVIAHEIHHMGQLSVWSREIEKNPVHANLVGRNLFG